MPELNSSSLHQALGLLAEVLEAQNHPAQPFLVCGGSSLLALGLVSRTTTQDVDILARVDDTGLVTPRPLPGWLTAAAATVAEQLNLPKGWLNDQVADETLFRCGLPEGLRARLSLREYGPRLLISYIGRRDQIFLKLHAAVDRDGGRHLQDLLELKPTADELLDGAKWAQTQHPSQGFLFNLKEMLKGLGHAQLINQL